MANTVNDALKDLYLACGGDPSKLTDNHDVSDYIRDLASVLTGGGGSVSPYFVVNFSYDESTESYTTDKTFDETKAAYDNGSLILFHNEGFNTLAIAIYDEGEFNVESSLNNIGILDSDEYMIDIYTFGVNWSNDNLEVFTDNCSFIAEQSS